MDNSVAIFKGNDENFVPSVTWAEVRERIRQMKGDSTKNSSYRHSLAYIAMKAMEWGLDPTPFMKASRSNLERMIVAAKMKIEHEDRAGLQDFLWKAMQMPYSPFAMLCGKAVSMIKAKKHVVNGMTKYLLVVDEDEMKQIEWVTRYTMHFEKIE